MKKLWALAASVLLFFSCKTSAGIVFDDSVPVGETAQIFTSNIGDITGYNGITVDWKRKYFSTKTIQIPAGDTLLQFGDIKSQSGFITYTGKNIMFRYNFQPQKTYYFLVHEKPEEGTGLNVYAWDFGERIGVIDKAHLVEFVPFVNTNNRGDQKTVLD
jgi:hypothetical protein